MAELLGLATNSVMAKNVFVRQTFSIYQTWRQFRSVAFFFQFKLRIIE